MQNTQVIESWKPKTPREAPRSKKDENINQIYDCEESERKSEIQTTRPTTKYEEKRTRPEDCIRYTTENLYLRSFRGEKSRGTFF